MVHLLASLLGMERTSSLSSGDGSKGLNIEFGGGDVRLVSSQRVRNHRGSAQFRLLCKYKISARAMIETKCEKSLAGLLCNMHEGKQRKAFCVHPGLEIPQKACELE
jgi:hypothetical protein